jgi:Ca2+-binding EF-hand superfamily protein
MNKYLWTCVLCLAPPAAFSMPPQFVEGPPAAGQRGADERNAAKGGAAAGQPAGRAGGRAGGPAAVEFDGAAVAPNGAAATNRMFAVIDANSDGVINTAELRRAVVALKTLDADGDGTITMAEASASAVATPAGNAAQMVEQTLTQFDKNRDGRLTADEMPPEMATMFRTADQNGDSALSRQELAAAMGQMQNMFWNAGGTGLRGGADAQMGQRMMQQMAQWDRNRDGRLSPDEIPPQMRGMFQGADRNNDGAIDAQEMQAFIGQMGQRMGGRGPGERGFGGEPGPGGARGPRRGQ